MGHLMDWVRNIDIFVETAVYHAFPFYTVYGNGSHYMNTGGQSPDSGSKGQSLTSSSKGAY